MRDRPTGGAPGRPRVSAWSTFTGAEAYPRAEHSLVFTVVVLLLLTAKGFVRGRGGHTRMAIRAIDVATRTIGIRPLRTKPLARPRDRPLVPDIDAKGGIESGGADGR
jgi:ABC-type branched-subunit amino acid transport system permease subunit